MNTKPLPRLDNRSLFLGLVRRVGRITLQYNTLRGATAGLAQMDDVVGRFQSLFFVKAFAVEAHDIRDVDQEGRL